MAAPQQRWSLTVTMPSGKTFDARLVADRVSEQVLEYASFAVHNQDQWIAHLQRAASIVISAISTHAASEPARAELVVDTFLDGLIDATTMLKGANVRDPGRQVRDSVAISNIFTQVKESMDAAGFGNRHLALLHL
jgi:hypothetical protein